MESKALVLNPARIFESVTNAQSIVQQCHARRIGAGFETTKALNAEMGTCGVKLVSVDCLQQLDVMPPKAQRNEDTGRSDYLVFWTSD